MVRGDAGPVGRRDTLRTPIYRRTSSLAMDASTALPDHEGSLSTRRQVVLVVDDEPDILASIKSFLEGALENVHVETATSGPQALHYVRENAIDLILSDYRMPDMNGLEPLEEVRRLQTETPRILMTAYPELEVALDAINSATVEGFFTKPLEPTSFAQSVTKILRTRHAKDLRERAYGRALDLLRQRRGPGRRDGAPAPA